MSHVDRFQSTVPKVVNTHINDEPIAAIDAHVVIKLQRDMANVFGALNRFISRLDSEQQSQQQPSSSAYGFQVLKNHTTDLNLDPWFDFIIGINGRNIVSRPIIRAK